MVCIFCEDKRYKKDVIEHGPIIQSGSAGAGVRVNATVSTSMLSHSNVVVTDGDRSVEVCNACVIDLLEIMKENKWLLDELYKRMIVGILESGNK